MYCCCLLFVWQLFVLECRGCRGRMTCRLVRVERGGFFFVVEEDWETNVRKDERKEIQPRTRVFLMGGGEG